jgi:hypothetical protein
MAAHPPFDSSQENNLLFIQMRNIAETSVKLIRNCFVEIFALIKRCELYNEFYKTHRYQDCKTSATGEDSGKMYKLIEVGKLFFSQNTK